MGRAALIVLAMSSVACGGFPAADPTSTPSSSPTPAPISPSPAPPTFALSPSLSIAPRPSLTPPAGCPGDWRPVDGGCAIGVVADLDGDGTKETLSLVIPYPPSSAGRPREWRVTGRLSGGATLDGTIVPDFELVPEVVGAVDMDLDGRDEIVVEVHRGASAGFLGVYQYAPPRLVAVQLNRDPLWIGYAGSVAHGDGGECLRTPQGARLVIRNIARITGAAATGDAELFRWLETTYRWEGNELVRVSSREGEVKAVAGDRFADEYLRFWNFDCFGLHAG